MKNFIKDNYVVILTAIALWLLVDGCNSNRKLSKISKSIENIEETTYTKNELSRELKIMGLESEKRMIQATDRKLIDVQRQTEIDNEIKKLNGIVDEKVVRK